MKALICVGEPDLVAMREVSAPVLHRDHALIQVEAVSANRGELHRLMRSDNLGWQPGWDFAGTVVHAAGSGLAPGSRAVGILTEGSWAEQGAVPIGQLAAIPDGVTVETAAAVPTAGLTALRALRLCGDLAGRSVLIVGAAGGVGRFAVQLARGGGAQVTALVGNPRRAVGLAELGAQHVVVGPAHLRGGYDVILESAGGASLRDAFELIEPRGVIVCFGNSSQSETTFSVSNFYPKQATLHGFHLLNDLAERPPAADLAHLMQLCATGALTVDIDAVADWTEATAILDALRARQIAGKAIMRIGG
jgi:NADPH:quinone reductase-like Zn-dependent oxidoreductase